ncbi:MAG: aminotransferase class IV [Acidimicrobiales bacterium]|nr:aminotransferase class IV [Acidimicrobiales bacterium]
MIPVWLNGELVDPDDARVPVFDHGLTVGDGAFETLRTQDGVPFAVTRHIARLRRSLAGLGLDVERPDQEIANGLQQVADTIDGPAKLRLTATAGPGPLGSGRDPGAGTVYIAGAPLDGWPATGSCVTVPWRRNEHSALTGLKTTSYAENVVALAAAKERDASEAILANTGGALCEGTGSNVFVVHDGHIRTPSLESGCLAGITRALVLECLDMEVEEASLSMDDLARADEVFLTSSTRDVHPQHAVDDRRLDAPGPHSATVVEAFAALAADDLDP